jgi:hypothetical protein
MNMIQILKDGDIITKGDYIRPLEFVATDNADGTIHVNYFSMYGGRPMNNTRWLLVQDYIGNGYMGNSWIGHTYGEYMKAVKYKHEAVRGQLPINHIWDWKKSSQK